jgi:hypothetical protein
MEKSSFQIFDNFLDKKTFNEIADFVCGAKFPWFYGEHVSLDPTESSEIKDPLALETWGFHHSIYEKEWDVKSFTYKTFESFLEKIQFEFGFKDEHLIRARTSLKFQKNEFTTENYNMPHVDYCFPHESFIFYLNDSDGDTRIFEEWHDPSKANISMPTVFHTQARIAPKANRLLWINGLQYHTASNPIKSQRRIIANINFLSL